MTILRHIVSIFVLPVTVTILIPYLILTGNPEPDSPWSNLDPLKIIVIIVGIGVLSGGLTLAGLTIRHFARIGRGTLAPWDPPKRLVVTGVYRYVRNPMISGVLLILLGETILFRSTGLLQWAIIFFIINATYIPLIEEPGLERRFGSAYQEYKKHVPRWLPRTSAWTPPEQTPLRDRTI